MDIFHISLFGHRKIDDIRLLDSKLIPLIKDLLQTNPYVSFLIGRNGEYEIC